MQLHFFKIKTQVSFFLIKKQLKRNTSFGMKKIFKKNDRAMHFVSNYDQ